MPEIRASSRVSSFATPCTWTVATDRGDTEFVLKGEEDIRRLRRVLAADRGQPRHPLPDPRHVRDRQGQPPDPRPFPVNGRAGAARRRPARSRQSACQVSLTGDRHRTHPLRRRHHRLGRRPVPFLAMALALRARGHRVASSRPSSTGRRCGRPACRSRACPPTKPCCAIRTCGIRRAASASSGARRGRRWRASCPSSTRLPPDERCVLLVHPLALPEADLCRAARPGLQVAAAYLAPANLLTVHDPLLVGPWRVPAWVPLGGAPRVLALGRAPLHRSGRAGGRERGARRARPGAGADAARLDAACPTCR